MFNGLGQKALVDQDWYLPRFKRYLYTMKATICILLRRWKPSRANTYVIIGYSSGGKYTCPGEPTEYWVKMLIVGGGLFRGWWVAHCGD
jgi:hypothetical protein